MEGYRFRPPQSYHLRVVRGPQRLYAWEGARRPDGSRPALTVMVVSIPPSDNTPYHPDDLLDRFLLPIKQRRKDWTQIPTQYGPIGGIPFARTRWVGTDTHTKRKLLGCQYAAVDGRTILVMASEDNQDQDTAVKLAETAFLTLRRPSAK